MPSNELRLFVSSTFRDLMPEREQLVKKVFPRIRKECRARGVEFTEIDLRWGITEEESRTGKTVRICLEEIDKCRPYFIGIIGSRYGWIPGITEIEKDPEMLKEFPWLQEYAAGEKSIIEMEFAHGAVLLKNDSAFFYEQSFPTEAHPSHVTHSSHGDDGPLDALKDNLQSSGLPYRKFSDPEELGEQVFQDILTILDRDFPKKAELTPLERERIEHEAYARNRRQSYVANPAYYDAFVRHVMSDGPPLIIWGKSGLGKSALMAYLTHEYQSRNPNAFVVQHFIGAAEGSDPEDVMRQVMMEIKERYQLSDTIPTDDNNLREEFPVWIAKIKPEDKLVLLIDALNQLTGIAPEMHWMPEFIPPNVRLVLSTTSDSLPLEQLRKRNWNELELQPLNEAQRESIAREFLSRYHKSLTAEDHHILSSDKKSSSPLFLRTVLEELRIFGHHTTLHQQLDDYLASADERELFQKVLARMERDHGEEAVRSVMTAIWASRHGLSEAELMDITGLSRIALSEMMIAMEYHLMQREGFHTFFHNYLREAIERRYVPQDDAKKAAHTKLGDYFSTREYGHRRTDEEPWQWQSARDAEKFKACITDITMLDMLLDESHRQQLNGYWLYLQDKHPLAETYHAAMEDFARSGPAEKYFADVSAKLGNALVAASIYPEAEAQLRTALDLRKKLFGAHDLTTAESMNDLATLFYHTGKFAEAEELLKTAIAIREKIIDLNDPKIALNLNDLGTIYYSVGNLDEADQCFRNALGRYQNYFRRDNQYTASTLSNIGSILFSRKKYNEAIPFFTESMEMYQRLNGKSDAKLIAPMTNLALTFVQTEEKEKAEEYYLSVLNLSRSIYGENHYSVSDAYHNLGVFNSRSGKPEKAIQLHTKALEIRLKLHGEEHRDTINSYISLGFALYRAGELEKGEKLIVKYLPILQNQLGANHHLYLVIKTSWDELRGK